MLLAFDTTLDVCSVALVDDSGRVASHIFESMGRGHAEALVPMIAQSLEEAGADIEQVKRIAVTTGPGTFTGVRVGISAARGLALALAVPVAGISTLEMLAAGAVFSCDLVAGTKILAAIDARRGQAYLALYQVNHPDNPCPLTSLAAPAAVALEEAGAWLAEHFGSGDADDAMVVVGSAANMLGGMDERLYEIVGEVKPDAVAVARLALTLSAARWDGRPKALYLRPPDAKLPASAL